MTYRVDAAVETVKPSPPKAPLNGVLAEPERIQLSTRDNSVLLFRELRNAAIRVVLGDIPVHMTGNSPRGSGSPPTRG